MADWRSRLEAFRGVAGSLPLEPQVESAIASIPVTRPLLLACSGGADSVFLVLALLARFPDRRKHWQVLHYNHGLRGRSSEEDAGFVEELARDLGLAFFLGSPQAPLEAGEAALRSARYAWMEEVYVASGAGGLCLGHHADDLLENQLMALLSGSGPAGLGAPLPVKRFANGHVRIRPLLRLRRRFILQTLTGLGIPWREDATNQEPAFTRNWIRKEILPLLKSRFPQDIFAGSQRTRDLMTESVEAFDALLEEAGLDDSHPEQMDFGKLLPAPRALLRRAFMSWWLRHHAAFQLGKPALEAVLDRIMGGERGNPVSIGQGFLLIMTSRTELCWKRESALVPEHWTAGCHWSWSSGPLFLPDGARLEGEWVEWSSSDPPPYQRANPETEAWLCDPVQPLFVRQWQPGDRYQPLGGPGNRKLQDLFTDARIPRERRMLIPVLLDSNQNILWVPGFPGSQQQRLGPSAKSSLKLTYHPHCSGFE